MIISTEIYEGETWYTFSKGRFSYSAKRCTSFADWDIWTTDSSTGSRSCKSVYEREMTAKIWKTFFALVNVDAVAA